MNDNGPQIAAIFGPTGVGKTDIAIALADQLRDSGERPVAVSVDSMQVYREIPIITGAVDAQQRERLEHRLVGHISVADNYDVARHAQLCHREIDELRSEGRRPIVVGGTGLYLRAALCELDLLPPPSPNARERLSAELAQDGQEVLYGRLQDEEPDVAITIDPNDSRRTIRALEALEAGVKATQRNENMLWTAETRAPTALFALVMEREELYDRIDRRVDAMIRAGAELEVRGAAPLAGKTARQALGFEELLSGDIDALKTNSRRYAKRQLTWLRKLAGATTIDVSRRDAEDVASQIASALTD